ncbi:MAG: hypothetical protein KatS3mg108_3747 [Isosphaeraceae bacterium]|nr:MAG: hypothetical protein KatS3mg108_3747 [Isosphaeraceae bacterium]
MAAVGVTVLAWGWGGRGWGQEWPVGGLAVPGSGAVRSRTLEVEGPGGRSYRRQLEIRRGLGGVSRSLEIERPGGARFESQIEARRPGPASARLAAPSGGPRVVQRNVTINQFGGPAAWGPPVVDAGPSFSFWFGSPPPPIVPVVPVPLVPPPVVVVGSAAAPNVVVREPERYRVEPETIVVDPVAESLKRLGSHHGNSRRDGARELGRLGDARAVPALMQVLRDDRDAEVRQAAAWALGEIGDPRARSYLERAAVYDRKEKVRQEAARALRRLVVAKQAIVEGEVVELGETVKRGQPEGGAVGTRSAWPPDADGDVPAPPVPRGADLGEPPAEAEELLPEPLPPLDPPGGRAR